MKSTSRKLYIHYITSGCNYNNLITLILFKYRYLMGIGETEAFSERMKEEILSLEATNVYSLLEIEPFVDEVPIFMFIFISVLHFGLFCV